MWKKKQKTICIEITLTNSSNTCDNLECSFFPKIVVIDSYDIVLKKVNRVEEAMAFLKLVYLDITKLFPLQM